MASSPSVHHLAFFILFLVNVFPSSHSVRICTAPTNSLDIPIFHIYGKCSPFTAPTTYKSWVDTVLGMAKKDPARLAYLASLVQSKSVVPIASGQQVTQTANYILRTKLGTPAQTLFMVLDTSSDAAWVPCSGCTGCPASSATFSATNSTTYSTLDCTSAQCSAAQGAQPCSAAYPSLCTFSQPYGGDSTIAGVMSRDSLTLGEDVVPNYAFGCVNSVTGTATSLPKQGLLGLGRGPTSLMSQTGSLYGGVFSYCLPSFKSYYFSGSLKLGLVGQPVRIRTTPLLRNPHRPSLYYVNLTGITVGRMPLAVDPSIYAFNTTSGAGTIVDSGTVITRFVAPLYAALRDEFRKQVGASEYTSLGAFDTCFTTTADGGPAVPTVTLRFAGLDLPLPVENTLIHSSATPLACLAMASAPANVNSVLNVIANLQQQNHRVLFDVANSRVGFAREVCN